MLFGTLFWDGFWSPFWWFWLSFGVSFGDNFGHFLGISGLRDVSKTKFWSFLHHTPRKGPLKKEGLFLVPLFFVCMYNIATRKKTIRWCAFLISRHLSLREQTLLCSFRGWVWCSSMNLHRIFITMSIHYSDKIFVLSSSYTRRSAPPMIFIS